MKHRFTARNIDELSGVAQEIWKKLKDDSESNIVLFYGDMGAGKTTLIRNMCDVVDVTDTVTSPTFAIINEYQIPNDKAIYHFDFYRVESIREVYDLGYEEYFYSDNFCFIEWPEKIVPIIEACEDTLKMAKITITVCENGGRNIELEMQ